MSLGWLLYSYFGHQLIRAMYEGRSIGILNKIIEGQAVHPVEKNFKEADAFFIIGSWQFFFISIFIFVFFTNFKIFLKQELSTNRPKKFCQIIRKQKRFILVCITVFISFYILYLAMASRFVKSTAFNEYDVLFGIDTPRVINDIAIFSANHYRTKVHPIYVILVNPLGSLINALVNSKVMTAVLINSFTGAFGVVLAFIFFWLYSRNYTNSVLLSFIFGLSASQLFLSIIPDTSSLATCSLILSYILLLVALQTKKSYFIIWVLAGIFSLGVTTTNFIQTLICFGIATTVISKNEKNAVSDFSKILSFLSFVLVLTIFISIIQKAIYLSSRLFFLPNVYREEFRFASLLITKQPLEVITQIIKHFFLVNIIAPLPAVFSLPKRLNPAIAFSTSWNYIFIGWLGAGLWLCLFLGTIVKNIFSKWKYSPLFLAMFLCLAFNIALHSFYGIGEKGNFELFLYTGNFTFIVLYLLSAYAMSKKFIINVPLVILSILMGINNLIIINRVLVLYR